MNQPGLSIIIPASNEGAFVDDCLDSLLAQRMPDAVNFPIQVVVVANGCRDDTAAVASRRAKAFVSRGWQLDVLDLDEGSKPGALNAGDAASRYGARLYLDADVRPGDRMLGLMIPVLVQDGPIYAGARLCVVPPRSVVSRLYARFWSQLPFITDGVSGAGLFAVNAEGRKRWGVFPDIIADDALVRSCFTPEERFLIPEDYQWPLAEGFWHLVRIRRRQDHGVRQLTNQFPELSGIGGDSPTLGRVLRIAAADPLGFATYATVSAFTKLRNNGDGFTRGR